jgi:hypothetical protein
MRVLLRNARVRLYYAGRKHWVGKSEAAADLGTIERAAELSRDENFEQMEILVDDGDPSCDLVLPLKTRSAQGQLPGERPQ